MSQEKVAASSESLTAMAFAGLRLGNQLASLTLAAMWQPKKHSPIDVAARASTLGCDAMLDGLNVGIEPYRKRARSNLRRLSGK